MAEAVVAPEVTESPLQGQIEESACLKEELSDTKRALPMTEAVFAAEASKSPFKVEETSSTVEAVISG